MIKIFCWSACMPRAR